MSIVKIDNNRRVISGCYQERRFAYLHKKDRWNFGLLEAVDYKDAMNYLGKGFYIRQTWLTSEEINSQIFDKTARWLIVSSIFLDPRTGALLP